MVRVLVTGAEGGLGRAWVRRLRAPGFSLSPAFPSPVEVIGVGRKELDIAVPAVAGAIQDLKPDIVLNCAGRVELDFCESSPWEAFRVNRDGADHVARACSKLGALAVYLGTDLVFDGGKLQPYVEEDPPNPLNVYGESKLAGELRTASLSRRHLIIRSGWIYGQPGTHFLKPLFGAMPFQAIDTQIGQATWVQDFLDGVLFLLREGKTGRWHVASAGAVTQAQVVEKAREGLGPDAPPSRGRDPHAIPRVPGMTALDGSKLEGAGHTMRPWEEGLEAYLKTIATR